MKHECALCHQEFESAYRMLVCDDCYNRILQNMEKGEPGICPVCGVHSDAIFRNPRKKFCGNRCHHIGHAVISRKYRMGHSQRIREMKKNRLEKKKARLRRKRLRIDEIALIGKSMDKSYGITRMLLQQRAAREGISIDIAIAAVRQERGM